VETIGISKFQRQLSHFLQRVQLGEVFEITHRGRPIARLVPPQESLYERLVAAGELTPGKGRLTDMPPPIRLAPGKRLPSEYLDEMREDRL